MTIPLFALSVLRKTHRLASPLRNIPSGHTNCLISVHGRFSMCKNLLAGFCAIVLLVAMGWQAMAQQNSASDQDKNTAEKTADKAKEVGSEVVDKAGDVVDHTKEGTKSVTQGAKSVGN